MRLARFMRSSEIFAVTAVVLLAALLAQVGPAQQGVVGQFADHPRKSANLFAASIV